MASDKSVLSTSDITFTAVGVALITVGAWVSVPLGPIPFTLHTLALAFVLVGMSARQATLSVVLYIALGGLGLPLFAGMKGGLASLAGPTGGFLLGFLVAAFVSLLVRRLMAEGSARDVVTVVAMLVCSYGLGMWWLMTSTGMGFAPAFAAACAPFIIPDIVKVAVGITLARAVKHAVPSLQVQQ